MKAISARDAPEERSSSPSPLRVRCGATTVRDPQPKAAMTFADLRVPADLIAALAKQGITEPTPIQDAALPVLLEGKDAYLNAETGTGKTLAYLLPLFERIDAGLPATQLMILAPTHELAIQIQRQCVELAQNAARPIRTLLLIGGTSTERQIEKLKKKPQIVVGSAGRIRDLLPMGKLKGPAIRAVVPKGQRALTPV